jgi:hypothetical protein
MQSLNASSGFWPMTNTRRVRLMQTLPTATQHHPSFVPMAPGHSFREASRSSNAPARGRRYHSASARQTGIEDDDGEDDAGEAAWPEPPNKQFRGGSHPCSRKREKHRQYADYGQAEHGIDQHLPSHLW